MNMIKIKSSVKTLEVEWPNGKKTIYCVDVGNRDVMKSYIEKGKSIDDKINNLKDSSNIDELYSIMEEMFGMIDVKIYNDVKKRSKGSIFAMGQVIGGLSKIVKEGFEEGAKLLG